MNITLSRIRRGVRMAALALAVGAAGYAAIDAHATEAPAPAQAATVGHGIAVQVVGNGTPVLFIPGLDSGADTWRDTCAALQPDHVQCHLVQLPGFAGQPAVASKTFTDEMSRDLLDYIRARHLEHAVVVGHSLGGFIALKMAIAQPQAIDKLVIVDSLPFLPAAQNPAATAESVQPNAERMREQLLKADGAARHAQAEAAACSMVHDPAHVAEITRWGDASNPATTAQAMYELMTTDLRPALGAIRAPTLVLASWAGLAPYGATKATTTKVFESQYAKLANVRIVLSDAGYHFLMWDDANWLQSQLRGFIKSDATARH